MAIEIVADQSTLAARVADCVCGAVRRKAQAILGVPTGATFIETYLELARRAESAACDMRRATAFAVDEFLGAERTTPGTNSAFFRQYFRAPLRALHVPNPASNDPEEHIAAFAASVRRAGGFDLVLLGIGTNGHIAFNEPGSPRDSRARVVQLTDESRKAHVRNFGSIDAVPKRGLTLGVADLLESRMIIAAAAGAHKADVVARAIEEAPTDQLPASWLQGHPQTIWVLDEPAASRLTRHPDASR